MEHNFNDKKYDIYKEEIDNQRSITPPRSWDDIKNRTFSDIISGEIEFKYFKDSKFISEEQDISFETWQKLVEFKKNESKPKETRRPDKASASDARIPKDRYSQWVQYKKTLTNNGFSYNSIQNIENDVGYIIRYLSTDTKDSSPIKGLAIGDVQSGKTANMAGLISMAADNGFNFFIVLSGVIENLRKQTANRLYRDLDNSSQFDWTNIDNPKLASRNPESDWTNINLNNPNKKYYLVSLKNKSRLDNLIKWLYSDKNKLDQLKILIIDDEADQASINTKKLEDEDQSTINNLILSLVNGYNNQTARAVNYISYTATPYANVLNEIGPESLYPKDFIYTLTPSTDYIGAKKMFGLEEPESAPDLNIVRNIPQSDFDIIQQIHKGNMFELPVSFKKAINWFIIASAIQRHYEYNKPVSMLVHTSLKINYQEIIAKAIHHYLDDVLSDRESYFKELEQLYENETSEFSYRDFMSAMPEYSNASNVSDYPSWDVILKKIKGLINPHNEHYVDHINLSEEGDFQYHKGIHLIIDNSRTRVDNQQVRLVYPTKKMNFAPLFIVVGGNTLSRGLTLEGLVSSYFIRQTKQADTLYQMGRWFGYRMNYELLQRVWLDSDTKERFEFISQLNQELIEEINTLNSQLTPPSEVGVKIKNSPNYAFLRITSNNKMQSAIEADLDFTGFSKQTILFKNEKKELESNLKLTENFLNSLSNLDDVSKGKMVWRNVEYEKVRDYLSNMYFSKRDLTFSNIKAFLDWYDSILEESGFENWNVVLSTKGSIPKYSPDSDRWNIHGYSPNNVIRSRKGEIQIDGKTISIGTLRSSKDLVSDIPNVEKLKDIPGKINQTVAQEVRQRYGLGNVPQLIIYRIDKDSRPNTHNENSERQPVNFEADMIGINLAMPGIQNRNNLARKITIKVPDEDMDTIDDEE